MDFKNITDTDYMFNLIANDIKKNDNLNSDVSSNKSLSLSSFKFDKFKKSNKSNQSNKSIEYIKSIKSIKSNRSIFSLKHKNDNIEHALAPAPPINIFQLLMTRLLE